MKPTIAVNLTMEDRENIAEACALAIEYLELKQELHSDYTSEDVASMGREIEAYDALLMRMVNGA